MVYKKVYDFLSMKHRKKYKYVNMLQVPVVVGDVVGPVHPGGDHQTQELY